MTITSSAGDVQSLRIAFDAKRAYQNGTGLGHYSRTLISSLATGFPQHQYYLCAPKITNRFNAGGYSNVHNITPQTWWAHQLPAIWRGNWVKADLQRQGIQLYHGLSHEVPTGIGQTGIRSVVTIHDLIFERYPRQYNPIDVQVYRRKFTYACRHADKIISISQQTANDVVEFYHIPREKIAICYQSCNPAFAESLPSTQIEKVKKELNLPATYFLYVGSIIERKNLLAICQAYHMLGKQFNIPLVAIGDGGAYKKQVQQYIAQHGLQSQVILLSDTPAARQSADFQNAHSFPAIYQGSMGMLYPSVFEGFGIPVLEAMSSGIPVITSNVSCLPETGGDAAYYVDPYQPEQIAEGLRQLAGNTSLVAAMVQRGRAQAARFTPMLCAQAVMEQYLTLL